MLRFVSNCAALILVCLYAALLAGCEDGNPAYDPDPYWTSELYADWLTADSVRVTVRFAEYDGYRREEIRTGEFKLFTGASKDGPWTAIDYQVWRNTDIDREFVYNMKVPQPSALTYYYLESRFYVGSELGASYYGPVIATTSPLMTPENWHTLPNLTTTVPYGSTDIRHYDYCASALSPDGAFIFIQDDMNRVYDIMNGQEQRRAPLHSNEYEQGRSYWFDSGIYIQDWGLTVIELWSLSKRMDIHGWHTFLRGDSMFVIINDTNWYTYNVRTQILDSIQAEFPTPKVNVRKATISQSPSGTYYGANDWYDGFNQWRLYDSQMRTFRSLSPVYKSGTYFRKYSWFEYDEPLFLDMYWISDDVVMMKTTWSGEGEFWCYRISTSTYYQITGRMIPGGTEGRGDARFYTRSMTVNPIYDGRLNRVLFIYDLDKSTHAVRGFTPPR